MPSKRTLAGTCAGAGGGGGWLTSLLWYVSPTTTVSIAPGSRVCSFASFGSGPTSDGTKSFESCVAAAFEPFCFLS